MLSPDDARHGTLNGYSNLQCRCQPCRDANAAWQREKRSDRAAKPVPQHAHGTLSGYTNYRCRCRACKDAHATYRRDYLRRMREVTA